MSRVYTNLTIPLGHDPLRQGLVPHARRQCTVDRGLCLALVITASIATLALRSGGFSSAAVEAPCRALPRSRRRAGCSCSKRETIPQVALTPRLTPQPTRGTQNAAAGCVQRPAIRRDAVVSGGEGTPRG